MRRRKGEVPPTNEQVRIIVRMSGMRIHDFEKFCGMPLNTITNTLGAYNRSIPKDYWHIFFNPPKAIVDNISELYFRFKKNDDANETKKVVEENHVKDKIEVKKIGVLADLLKD